MEKINKIVKSLSDDEYETLLKKVSANNADKSSMLLSYGRSRNYADKDCIDKLSIKANAFYTLKSRLNQKIEAFLISKMEAPKLELIKKVSYASDIVLNTDKEISAVTLKKLERELKDYDLAYELTKIYQNLKKLYRNDGQQHYHYSQLYNKHVAYTLALDRAEDMVGSYFYTYGHYFMSRNETDLLQLYILRKELENTCKLYSSHRLFISGSMVNLFHVLFLPQEDGSEPDLFSLEEIFDQANEIFNKYNKDTFYLLITPVFTYLQFEFYFRTGQKQKAQALFDDLNGDVPSLLEYFNFYTFPSLFLFSKIIVVHQKGEEQNLVNENMEGLVEYEPDLNDIPGYLNYNIYLATSYFYDKDYEMAARTLQEARNNVSFKGLTHIDMEIKLLLGMQYVMLQEFELTGQLIKSIQRQVRNAEDKGYADVAMFVKMLNKFSIKQPDKAKEYYDRFKEENVGHNRVIPYLFLKDEVFNQ